MMELVLAIALLWAAWRLRRAGRQPLRPIRIDVYHHLVPGPGERIPADEDQEGAASNVVPFRRVRR